MSAPRPGSNLGKGLLCCQPSLPNPAPQGQFGFRWCVWELWFSPWNKPLQNRIDRESLWVGNREVFLGMNCVWEMRKAGSCPWSSQSLPLSSGPNRIRREKESFTLSQDCGEAGWLPATCLTACLPGCLPSLIATLLPAVFLD